MALGTTAHSILAGTGFSLASFLAQQVAQQVPAEWSPVVGTTTLGGLLSALFVFVLRRTTENSEALAKTYADSAKDMGERFATAQEKSAASVERLQTQLIEALQDCRRPHRGEPEPR